MFLIGTLDIWCTKTSCFFLLDSSMGKFLTDDNRVRGGLILVDWYYMCTSSGETVWGSLGNAQESCGCTTSLQSLALPSASPSLWLR